MVQKDLSSRQIGNLELTLGGRTYRVRPPSARDGEVLMKIVVLGFASTSIAPDEDITEETIARVVGSENLQRLDGEHAIDRLALGSTYDEMYAAGLPSADIATAAKYAAFYWVFGESVADKIVLKDPDEEGVEEVTLPKPSPSGPSTESESHEPTAPTPATTSHLPSESSSTSGSRKKKAGSRGKRSPSSGT